MVNWKRLTAVFMVSVMCLGTAFTSFAANEGNTGTDGAVQESDEANVDGITGSIPEDESSGGAGQENVPDLGNVSEGTLKDELPENTVKESENEAMQPDTANDDLQQTTVRSQKYPDIAAGSGAFCDRNGNYYTVSQRSVSSEVEQILDSQEKLRGIVSARYKVNAADRIVVLAASDFELQGSMPAGGLEMTVTVTSDAALKEGDPVYVLHQKHDGKWEILPSSVDTHGMAYSEAGVSVHLDSLSPIVIVKVMSGNSIKKLEEKSVSLSGTDNKEKKSPKTGDFF